MLGYKNENFVKSAEDMSKLVYADIGNQLGFNGINEDEDEEKDEKKDEKPEDAEAAAEEPETDEEPADDEDKAPAEEPEEEPEAKDDEDDEDETIEGKLKAALSDIGSAMYLLRQQEQQDLEEEELDPLNESIDPFAMARWTYLSRD